MKTASDARWGPFADDELLELYWATKTRQEDCILSRMHDAISDELDRREGE